MSSSTRYLWSIFLCSFFLHSTSNGMSNQKLDVPKLSNIMLAHSHISQQQKKNLEQYQDIYIHFLEKTYIAIESSKYYTNAFHITQAILAQADQTEQTILRIQEQKIEEEQAVFQNNSMRIGKLLDLLKKPTECFFGQLQNWLKAQTK